MGLMNETDMGNIGNGGRPDIIGDGSRAGLLAEWGSKIVNALRKRQAGKLQGHTPEHAIKAPTGSTAAIRHSA